VRLDGGVSMEVSFSERRAARRLRTNRFWI